MAHLLANTRAIGKLSAAGPNAQRTEAQARQQSGSGSKRKFLSMYHLAAWEAKAEREKAAAAAAEPEPEEGTPAGPASAKGGKDKGKTKGRSPSSTAAASGALLWAGLQAEPDATAGTSRSPPRLPVAAVVEVLPGPASGSGLKVSKKSTPGPSAGKQRKRATPAPKRRKRGGYERAASTDALKADLLWALCFADAEDEDDEDFVVPDDYEEEEEEDDDDLDLEEADLEEEEEEELDEDAIERLVAEAKAKARAKPGADGQSVLHSIRWRRVVLDEAHSIKDRKTNTAQVTVSHETP